MGAALPDLAGKVTEAELQKAFYYFTMDVFKVLVPNAYMGNTSSESDLFGVRRNHYCEEIEIKICPNDFKNDFKKKGYGGSKHSLIESGRKLCNRFSYLIPDNILDKCDIPEYAGLYVYDTQLRSIKKHKQGKLLHKNKIPQHIWVEAAYKMNLRYWRGA